ncbi:MAG TPA: hypothetical protein VG943_10815 [Caulobacterales bacterium]|nr:hypothetical protein [Caulobacterales bacterium]
MHNFIKALGAGIILACLGGAVSAQPQNQDAAAQARAYLDTGMAPHAQRGYARDPTVPDLLQPLRLDHPFLWPVYLHAGVNYRVYAACDNDCQDLDMEIYGADGMLADRDINTDDTPFVQVTPSVDGRYYVRVWVYQCSDEPCFVAARVVRGGHPEVRPDAAETAQNNYETVVRSELDDSGAALVRTGFTKLGDDFIGAVTLQSEGHREVMHLDAGRTYAFQGACDQDCSDVDMELLDPRGDQVAEDTESNDRPAVQFTPTRAGDYTVRIWLASCNNEPCYVGLRSYSRNGR